MKRHWSRIPPVVRLSVPTALAAALSFACVPAGVEENAVRRGDEAFARDSLEEALAEYRLAIRQGGEEPEVLARIGHTLVSLGRVEEGATFYTRASAREDRWADMGVGDLVRLARSAAERRDRFQMAAAMEAARTLRPGLSAPDLTLPLARHYFQIAEYGRALPLYQRLMAETTSPAPSLVREIAEAHHQVGDCRGSLVYFDLYRDLAAPRDRDQANWYIGECSFRLAEELRARAGGERSDLEEALRNVDRAIGVGEPQNLQGRMWLVKGEILSAMGACDAALEALAQVGFRESATSPWADHAQRRMADIRIGRGLVDIRGTCR